MKIGAERRLNKIKKRLGEKLAMVKLLEEEKAFPEEYRWLLLEGKPEMELIYVGKIMVVPLHKVKVFGDVKDCEIRFPAKKLTDRMMIIYMEVFGNERKENKREKGF